MYALFEDAGKFLAGRILSEAESSAQVELESGKRVKVKSAHLLLRFDKVDQDAFEGTAIIYALIDKYGWYDAPAVMFENVKQTSPPTSATSTFS